jgi:undecaprenyl-diphosphatase
MLEEIISLDKQLLVYLNSFGSPEFDNLWLYLTKQANWWPFFLLLAFLIYKKIGPKNLGIIILFIALLLLIGNESVEFVKNSVQRLRPCNDPEIKDIIRVVHYSKTFSFFSGHAANSIASMTFLFLILRKHYKYTFLIFLYPLIFAYSRIYLGVHFPIDILTGYTFGIVLGSLCYKGFLFFQNKYNF